MIELLLLGLALVVVAAAGIVAVEALVRRADLGAGLLLGATLLNAVLVGHVPAVTLPGGIRVQVHDVAFALVLAAGILRLLRTPRFTSYQRWVLVLGIMLALSLARGVMAFGIEHSVAEFRLFLPYISGVIYFMTFPPSEWLNDRIGKLWLATTVPMMVLVALRWLDIFAGVNLGVPKEEFGADAAVKVLDGPYTFFLASGALLTVPFWQLHDERARRLTRLGALLLLFVVLLNRRTVWLTIIIGIAVLMVRGRRLRRRAVAMVVGAVLLTVAAYIALGGSSAEEQPVARSAVGTGTLDWRVQGWTALLKGLSKGPTEWLIGEPLGSGFERQLQGSGVVEGEPHNFYVTTVLRTGVVGLVALIALTGGLLRALWRTPPGIGRGLLDPGVFPALLAMQVVWFLTWIPGMEQGIVTGLAVGLAALRERGRSPFPGDGLRPPAIMSGRRR